MKKFLHDGLASQDQIEILYFLEELDRQPKFDDAIKNDMTKIVNKVIPRVKLRAR